MNEKDAEIIKLRMHLGDERTKVSQIIREQKSGNSLLNQSRTSVRQDEELNRSPARANNGNLLSKQLQLQQSMDSERLEEVSSENKILANEN